MATTDRRGASVSSADPPAATTPNPDLAIKTPCLAATTGNHSLSGLASFDGYTPVSGDRILVWQQTDQTANGVYNASSGNWTRTTDADSNSQWDGGLKVFVIFGTLNGSTDFVVTNTGTITLGTTAITFSRFGKVTGVTLPAGPYAIGDLLYANTTTTMARLAAVAVGAVLVSAGVGAPPAWSSTLTLVGPSSLNRLIDVTQTFAGTDTVTHQLNQISITDTADLGANVGNGLNISHSFGGGTVKGSRQAVQIGLTLTSATNAGNTKHFYAALATNSQANSGDGGTNTGAGAKGSIIGFNPAVTLNNGATNLAEASGIQVTMFSLAGSSVSQRSGIEISDNSGAGGIQGATFDDAIVMGNIAGSAGWNIGIAFDRTNFGSAPLATGGTAIATVGAQTFATGIDFSSAVLTNFLKGPNNFIVDGSGNLQVNTGGQIFWLNRALITSPADGIVKLSNFAATGFTKLTLGPDVAAPGTSTISTQNVIAGTSNTAGANLVIAGSQGTGTGTGGAILLQVAPASGSSSTQNTLVTRQTILGNGQIGFGTETNPQARFVLSGNAATGITGIAGANSHTVEIYDADNTSAQLGLTSYGTPVATIFQFANARGTAASFSASQSGDVLGAFGAIGAAGANQWAGSGTSTARIGFQTTENFVNASNLGTKIFFDTTPTTTNVRANAMTLQASGGLSIGTTTDPATGGLFVNVAAGIGTNALTSAFLALAAGTTAKAQINLGASTAPTTPNNGDFWFDGTNFKARVAGATKTFTIT